MAIDSTFVTEIARNVVLPLMEIADELGLDHCKNLHLNVSNQLQDLDVALVGMYSSGKSSVLNTLFALGKSQKLPVKRVPTTMRMWRLEYGPKTTIQAKNHEHQIVRSFEMPELKNLRPEDPIFENITFFEADVDSVYLKHNKELVFWDTEGLDAPIGKGLKEEDYTRIRDAEILVWVCDRKTTKSGVDEFKIFCKDNPFAMVFVIMTNAEGSEKDYFHQHKEEWLGEWRAQLENVVKDDVHYLTLECKQAQAAIDAAFKQLDKSEWGQLVLGKELLDKIEPQVQDELLESGVIKLWAYFRDIRKQEQSLKSLALRKRLSSTIIELQIEIRKKCAMVKEDITKIRKEIESAETKLADLPRVYDDNGVINESEKIITHSFRSQKPYTEQAIQECLRDIREQANKLDVWKWTDNTVKNVTDVIFNSWKCSINQVFTKKSRELIIQKRWEICEEHFKICISDAKRKLNDQIPKIIEEELVKFLKKIRKEIHRIHESYGVKYDQSRYPVVIDRRPIRESVEKLINWTHLLSIDISKYELVQYDNPKPDGVGWLADDMLNKFLKEDNYANVLETITSLLCERCEQFQKTMNDFIEDMIRNDLKDKRLKLKNKKTNLKTWENYSTVLKRADATLKNNTKVKT